MQLRTQTRWAPWWVGACATLALALTLWAWHAASPDAAAQPATGQAANAGLIPRGAELLATAPTRVVPHGRSPDDQARAAGLSPEELRELRAELASHPDGEVEVQRVIAWLQFSQQWEHYDTARRQAATRPALRALAAELNSTLAQHWRQGELTGPQALQMKVVLLESLLDSEAERQAALQRWQAEHQPLPQPEPQAVSFEAEQALLVAAWRRLPAAQQQPAALQAQLQALRHKHFVATANASQGVPR